MSTTLNYFKALADETRLRLLNVLRRHELNVNELVQILNMGQSRVSRHLKILTAAGLLAWRREGLWVFYRAASEGEAGVFIDAVRPFMDAEDSLRGDLALAKGMLEERASKTRQFFNTIAEDWDKLSSRVLGDFDLAASVARHMPVCKVAADLGCGTGNVLHAMLEKAEAVIGVDGSPRMLELARRRLSPEMERVSLRIGDLAHLPLRDEEADFASLNLVLHHVPDPEEVLGEIRRVLTPAGTLLLTDFDHHDDEGMRGEYGDHWLGFEMDKLTGLLEKTGFRVASGETAPVRRNLRLHIVAARACV
jgi:ArsR family transcriptional regulator